MIDIAVNFYLPSNTTRKKNISTQLHEVGSNVKNVFTISPYIFLSQLHVSAIGIITLSWDSMADTQCPLVQGSIIFCVFFTSPFQ